MKDLQAKLVAGAPNQVSDHMERILYVLHTLVEHRKGAKVTKPQSVCEVCVHTNLSLNNPCMASLVKPCLLFGFTDAYPTGPDSRHVLPVLPAFVTGGIFLSAAGECVSTGQPDSRSGEKGVCEDKCLTVHLYTCEDADNFFLLVLGLQQWDGSGSHSGICNGNV